MWKLLMTYLAFMLTVVRPGVEDPFEDPFEDPNGEDPNGEDPNGEDPNGDGAPPPRQMSRAQRDIIATRERAQKAEEQLRQAQAELEAARRQPMQQQNQQPTEEQRVWQQEEEVLRNPESTDWQRYAVQANRQARLANSNSQNALRRAEDMADVAKFEQLAVTKPKLFNEYKDRVEAELTRLRANGSNAPREELLALLVGRDLRDGKLKPSAASTKKTGAGRGTTPGVRSDVNTSGGTRMSDAEKRAKRLENIRI